MMIFALVGLVCGVIAGTFCPMIIPAAYTKLFSVALLTSLDAVFGAVYAVLRANFESAVFISGFFLNGLMATVLVFAGENLGIDLYYVALFGFGLKIFQKIHKIRHIVFHQNN